ncbi:hypothetical protein HYC85_017472 [Camellia sinensis]|uniref:WAT1-related protein n=1 Tax=Camellia sinensis TaxID=4442 RepID=A0A7J7GT86_CAMSI|nr:hypothetical protein HYC85_017472 [Camellia sinensis]
MCRPANKSADGRKRPAGGVWGCLTRHSLPLQGKTQVFGAKPDTKRSSSEILRQGALSQLIGHCLFIVLASARPCTLFYCITIEQAFGNLGLLAGYGAKPIGPGLGRDRSASDIVLTEPGLSIYAMSITIRIVAFLLTKIGAELIIVFFYGFFAAIMTGILSLVMERYPVAWSLLPSVKLLSILFSGIVGSAIQVSILVWCLFQRGPLFIAVFHPLGIVISTMVNIIIFGDIFVMESIIIVIGFYSVMWGKSKEQKVITDDEETSSESPREKAPFLQNTRETKICLVLMSNLNYTYSGEASEVFDRDDNTLTLIKPSPMPSKDIRSPLEIGSVHGGNNGCCVYRIEMHIREQLLRPLREKRVKAAFF